MEGRARMLVLSRELGEGLHIAEEIKVHILSIKGNQVSLAFDAPRDIPIYRAELLERIKKSKLAS